MFSVDLIYGHVTYFDTFVVKNGMVSAFFICDFSSFLSLHFVRYLNRMLYKEISVYSNSHGVLIMQCLQAVQ